MNFSEEKAAPALREAKDFYVAVAVLAGSVRIEENARIALRVLTRCRYGNVDDMGVS